MARQLTKEELDDARRITIDSDGVTLNSGAGKKQRTTKNVFGLLRISGRVISVFSPVV